jgi:hypothetical protein
LTTGRLGIKPLPDFETTVTAASTAGFVPIIGPSELEGWRSGTGQGASPIRTVTQLAPAGGGTAITISELTQRAIIDAWKSDCSRITKHNDQLVQSSIMMVGDLQSKCDPNMQTQLEARRINVPAYGTMAALSYPVWETDDIIEFWNALVDLMTTSQAPTEHERSQTLKKNYNNCIQGGESSSQYVTKKQQAWRALDPLAPLGVTISERSAVADTIEGFGPRANKWRQGLTDAETIHGIVNARPITFAALLVAIQRQPFWTDEMRDLAAGKSLVKPKEVNTSEAGKGDGKKKNQNSKQKGKGKVENKGGKTDNKEDGKKGSKEPPARCKFCGKLGHQAIVDGKPFCFALRHDLCLETDNKPIKSIKPEASKVDSSTTTQHVKPKVSFMVERTSQFANKDYSSSKPDISRSKSEVWKTIRNDDFHPDDIIVKSIEEDENYSPIIAIDNAASISFFKDSDILENIHDVSAEPVISLGGSTALSSIGTFIPLSLDVYYRPDSHRNIIAHGDLMKLGYRLLRGIIEDDRDVFRYLHGQLPTLMFSPDKNSDLYTMAVNDIGRELNGFAIRDTYESYQAEQQADDSRLNASELNTVQERLRAFKPSEQRNICRAYIAFLNCGFPGIQKFRKMLELSTYAGWTITPQQFDRALAVFGLPSAVLRGRSQVKQPKYAPVRTIEGLQAINNEPLSLLVDTIFIDKLAFLFAIAEGLHYSQVEKLGPKSSKGAQTAAKTWPLIKDMISFFRRRQFKVREIGCDAGSVFLSMSGDIEDLGLILSDRPSGQHVKELEPIVRQLKQKVRGILYDLSYNIGQVLLNYLVKHCVQLINRQLSEVTSDPTRTPHELVFKTKLDANAHLTGRFGDRVHAYPIITTNTMQARGGDCILVGRDNSKGVLTLFNTETQRECSRTLNQIKFIPIDQEFITRVNSLWKPDDIVKKSVEVSITNHSIGDEDLDDSSDQGGEFDMIDAVLPDIFLPAIMDFETNIEDPLASDQDAVEGDESPGLPYLSPIESPRRLPSRTSEDLVSAFARRLTMGGDPLFQTEPEPAVTTQVAEEVIQAAGVTEPRRSTRHTKPITHDPVEGYATEKYGPKSTLEVYGEAGKEALIKELMAFDEYDCLKFENFNDLTSEEIEKARTTFMFTIPKYDAMGVFLKLKSRLISNGSTVLPEEMPIDTRGAPKIDQANQFALAALMHDKGWIPFGADHKSAYLRSHQPDQSNAPIVKLAPLIAKLYIQHVNPAAESYLTSKGWLFCRLKTGLYGEPNADKLWYMDLSEAHQELAGMSVNDYDGGCFFKEDLIVGIWTDNINGWAKSKEVSQQYLDIMEDRFPGMTREEGPIFSVLGVVMDYSEPKIVKISMEAGIQKLLDSTGVIGSASTPATLDIFERTESTLLEPSKAAEYHRIVNTILYFATHGRWDLVFPFSILGKRVSQPTEADRVKLLRTLRYMNRTKADVLVLSVQEMSLHYTADTSHLVHMHEGKGHLGAYISFGEFGPALWCSSTMVKYVTKSTAETEMAGFTEKLSKPLHMLRFFGDMGIDLGPIVGHEDNEAAISLMTKGKPCTPRTRHLDMRAFWAAQYIEQGILELRYKKNPAADILTKPKAGADYQRDLKIIMGR